MNTNNAQYQFKTRYSILNQETNHLGTDCEKDCGKSHTKNTKQNSARTAHLFAYPFIYPHVFYLYLIHTSQKTRVPR